MFLFEALYFLYKKKNSERIVVGETRKGEGEGEREREMDFGSHSINTYETEIIPSFLAFHLHSQKRTQRAKEYVRKFQESLNTTLSQNISRSLMQPIKGKTKKWFVSSSLPNLHFFNISCFNGPIKTYTRKSNKLRGVSKTNWWKMANVRQKPSLPLPNLFQVDVSVKFDVLQLLV